MTTFRFALAILLLSALSACGGNNRNETPEPKTVCVATPQGGKSATSRTFSGVVEEAHEINVGFKVAGQISRILVKEGQHVSKGQLLAVLDDADYRLGVEALQAQYDQTKKDVERAARVLEKKGMTASDYEKAATGLRQLSAQLQGQKNQVAYTRLYAPASGIVGSVNFSPGEMVDAGTSMFTLLDVSGMEVVADIPAAVYAERANFSGVTCTSTRGGSVWDMKVTSIVPKADGNQLYRMKLAFDSAPGTKLTPGTNMEVNIHIHGNEEVSSAMAIPAGALFRDGKDDCVWVVKADSTVERRKVTVLPEQSDAMVAISDGLTGEETIVRAGTSKLHEGEKVRILAEESETNVGGLL